MTGDKIWLDGRCVALGDAGFSLSGLTASDYVYHHIRTIRGRAVFAADTIEICELSCMTLYGRRADLTTETLDKAVADLMTANRYPHGNLWLTLYLLAPRDSSDKVRVMLDCDSVPVYDDFVWWHSTLRASAKKYEYPFKHHQTAASRAAHVYARGFAERSGEDAVLCTLDTGEILSCGDRPVFAAVGKTILTTPLHYGCADSAQRRAVARAAAHAGFRFEEIPLNANTVTDYQEMFTVDPRGIISIGEFAGVRMTNSAARIIADALNTIV